MDAPSLINEIRAAFRDVAKPPKDEIAPHECPQCDELRNDLWPYHSDNVSTDILHKHCWHLPLLSHDGKRFFLPSWLIASVAEPDSDYTRSLLMSFESDHRWQSSPPYTARQIHAVLSFLDFVEPRLDEFDAEHIANARKRWNVEP